SICHDAIAYAYGANDFVLRDSYPAFCNLGPHALASIRDLTVIHNAWTAENDNENRAWQIMKTECTGLKCLELDLHADMLLEVVAYLPLFFASLHPNDNDPTVILDLYVWERHFAFDSTERDCYRSLDLLQGNHQKSLHSPKFVHPGDRVMRLPPFPN